MRKEYLSLTGALVTQQNDYFVVEYQGRIVATEKFWECALMLGLDRARLDFLLQENNVYRLQKTA